MPDAVAKTTPCIQAQNALVAGDFQSETQTFIRSACTECKRRKQKCLRHWPCQHCGTRRVGNQCIFRTVLDVQSVDERKAQIDDFLSRMKGKCCFSHPPNGEEVDDGDDSTEKDLEQFGYAPTMNSEHPNDALRQVLRTDKAPPALELSNRLHGAASELHRAISPDAMHLYTVQQLLHSFFWLKSRSCYADCWGALRNAFVVFRGLNKPASIAGGIGRQIYSDSSLAANGNEDSNYLKEMGNRAWVVMTSWNCLDEPSRESGCSPIVITALQCILANRLLEKYGPPLSFDKTMEAKYPFEERIADNGKNHKAFDEEGSEKEDYDQFDANIWGALQDFILSIMRLSSALDALRSHLMKPMSHASPVMELRSRQQALRVALKYMNGLFKFLRFIFPEDGNYHIIIFLIFDVATLLCSAVLHDSDSSMPTRVTSWEAVQSTLCMLKKLSSKVPIAKKVFEVLVPMYNEMLKQSTKDEDVHQ
ncbi:hypothetical protein MKX08_006666 [Trichoderma sp. CBMAI-0020]|nr:hypothetical protein MKX08_006666 [Trichoderma sp. CBMAI-0020]